jgi:predicted permease
LPGVEAVATSWPLSYTTFSWTPKINLYGKPFPDGAEPMVETSAVIPEYFRTMGIPLRAGRGIESTDRAGARRVAVVSEEFVRQFWPEQNPIGQRVKLVGIPELDDLEIVGIVGGTRRAGPARRVFPEIYCAMAQFPQSGSTMVVRVTGDPLQLGPQIRQRIAQVNPDVAIVQTVRLQDALAESVTDRRLVRLVLGLFAGLALVLTAVGIYGVVAFAVESRTREIGLRVALGATGGAIQRLILRQGLLPVLIGIAAGIATAAAGVQILQKLVYGVSPRDPVTLGASAVILLLVSGLACLIPARRATRVDPMVALRHEQ